MSEPREGAGDGAAGDDVYAGVNPVTSAAAAVIANRPMPIRIP
jgi:hypothetical protein